jgi:hypothetical protein
MLEIYGLLSSQFVFSRAKRLPNNEFQAIFDSSISSKIISGKVEKKKGKSIKIIRY